MDQRINDQCQKIENAANSLRTATTTRSDDMSTITATQAAYSAQTEQLTATIAALQKEIATIKAQQAKTKKTS